MLWICWLSKIQSSEAEMPTRNGINTRQVTELEIDLTFKQAHLIISPIKLMPQTKQFQLLIDLHK